MFNTIQIKHLVNPRLATILFLGFASGLPLALTGSTLQAWFTEAHINLLLIGGLSLIGIPYNLKFLWAPLFDHFRFDQFGGRRFWMIISQLLIAGFLFTLAFMQPFYMLTPMIIIAFIISVLSASQDIVLDAYRVEVLPEQERGLGSSYYVFSYRLAMLVSGGLALIFADNWGWRVTYIIMGCLMLFAVLPTYFAPNSATIQPQKDLYKTIAIAFKDILQRDRIVLLLLFITLYKFGDAYALSLMMPFLIKGMGFSLIEIGFAYKLISFVAIVLGGFVGGILLIRLNIYKALLLFGLAQSFSNLLFVIMAMLPKSFLLMISSIFVENFCSGLSTAAFVAFLISLCNQRFSATQYALLSAFAFISRTFMGPVAALVVNHFGWVQFFISGFLLCLPGLVCLLLLKEKVLSYAHATAN